MRKTGFLYATLHGPPPKTYCEAHSGGCSDFRIILLYPEVLSTSASLPLPTLIHRPFYTLRAQDEG